MDKWELIEITLNQLIEQWENNKELFDIDDAERLTRDVNKYSEKSVTWSPMSLRTNDSKILTDPIKMRKGVVITYSSNEFRCLIYKIDQTSKQLVEDTITARKFLMPFRSLYKKFMRLRAEIAKHKRDKASSTYLSNLCGVFPGTLDEHILGSVDGEEEKD